MENIWHLRRVADNASKACWICYKPTTSVLITPNNKVRQNTPSISMELTYLQDFFYACPGHLVDRGFCQPDADEAAAVEAKKKKDELDTEIEKVKKEYEEKQKLKREKRKSKDKEKDKAKEKEAKSKDEEEDKQDEKAKDDKVYDEEQTYSRP
jgi:outer membrane biosynthesis protein TonB